MVDRFKFKFAFIGVVELLVLLCSCQPTPDAPIVVNKGNGDLQKMVYGTPAPQRSEPYDAPDTWTEEIDGIVDNKLLIRVNADITVPNALNYPIYRVQLNDYSQEYFETFLENTVGTLNLYQANGKTVPQAQYNESYTYTYAGENDCKAIIDGCNYQLSNPESPLNLYGEGYSDKEMQGIVKDLTERRSVYTYMLNHQDEFLSKFESDYSEISHNGKYASLLTDNGNNKVYFKINAGLRYIIGCEMDSSSLYSLRHLNTTSTKRNELNGIESSEDMLYQIALSQMGKLGCDNWTLNNVGSCQTACFYDSNAAVAIYAHGLTGASRAGTDWKYDFYSYYEKRDEMYWFTFTPTLSDIPVLYTSNTENSRYSEQSFSMPALHIGVDDSGVRIVELENGATTFNCVNNNVELLPFDKIQSIFRQYIVMYTDFSDTYIGGGEPIGQRDYSDHELTTINIDSIKLGYVKIKEINDSTYIAVPAWCFYGSEINRFAPEASSELVLDANNELISETEAGHSYLCINAIDGSIIDLSQGY